MEKKRNNELILGIVSFSQKNLEPLINLLLNIPFNKNFSLILFPQYDHTLEAFIGPVLRNYTTYPIALIHHQQKIESGMIYIVPPKYHIQIYNQHFHTFKDSKYTQNYAQNIELCYQSLVEHMHNQSIFILLYGLSETEIKINKIIHARQGLLLIQQEFFYAIDDKELTDLASDFLLPLEKISDFIISYLERSNSHNPSLKKAFGTDTLVLLNQIFSYILKQRGIDFTFYKENTLIRRLKQRMQFNHIADIQQYINFLKTEPNELKNLVKNMLIGVTSFFRDKEAFKILSDSVIPQIIHEKKDGEAIRVWIPGCSTGEEAYSIAILILEAVKKSKKKLKINIFATDIDEQAIQAGRKGIYPELIKEDMGENYLNTYFSHMFHQYQVNKEIRDIVIFSLHNLIQDPPFSRMDLISCRNLLIYLQPYLQKKILPLFHYALNPQGYLFLGTSETTGDFTIFYQFIDKKWKIFKKNDQYKSNFSYPIFPAIRKKIGRKKEVFMAQTQDFHIEKMVEDILRDRFTPPAVALNAELEILHYFGRTGKYLEPAPGRPSFNILKMAKKPLAIELKSLLDETITNGKEATRTRVKDKIFDNEIEYLDITAKPLKRAGEETKLYLVIFQKTNWVEPEIIDQPKGSDTKIIGKLKDELTRTKEQLKLTINEQEEINKELKTSNEELLTMNEELQVTTEELETSKEELQSVNEELVTINAELQTKVDELTRTNNDINNLLTSTRIATLFLDRNLNIKRFTPEMTKLFHLIPSDIGRPITDISHKISNIDLTQDSQEVLNNLGQIDREVQSLDENWFIMRILPYRTLENMIDGVVISFIDITEKKLSDLAFLESETKYKKLLMMAQEGILVFNQEGFTTFINSNMSKMLGYEEMELLGKNILTFFTKNGAIEFDFSLFKEEGQHTLVLSHKSGEIIFAQVAVTPMHNSKGHYVGSIVGIMDMSEHMRKENEIKKSLKEKEILLQEVHHRVKNNLQIISGLLAIQSLKIKNVDLIKTMQSMINRIKTMALLHDHLYNTPSLEQIPMEEFIKELVRLNFNTLNSKEKNITYQIKSDPIYLDIDKALPISLIINELITNALKFAFKNQVEGQVNVLFINQQKDKIQLKINDNGSGLMDFDKENPATLGLELVQILTDQLGGSMEIDTQQGTSFQFLF